MNVISPSQFNQEMIDELFDSASKLEKNYDDFLNGKIMATVFLEPSTRTRLSFESAMLRLGGKVISCSDLASSSVAKGETVYDTIMTVSQYADVVVVRSPMPINPHVKFPVPVINAGDGSCNHPTQALLDAYTIWKIHGKIDNLKIGIAGDLRGSRTIHSLVELLKHRNDLNLLDTMDCQNKLPEEVLCGSPTYHNEFDFDKIIPELDVLYTNRIQIERHKVEHHPRPVFSIDDRRMRLLSENAIVMNPGPRREELPEKFDEDPRVVFFKQARNGVYIRMALLKYIFENLDI